MRKLHNFSLRRAGIFSAVAAIAVLAAQGQDVDIPRTLKGIEDRYNRVQTLDVGFTETYLLQGRQRVEKGELFLRKPGRMRWQYTAPAGKLFVSDGKFVYYYSADEKRAEKMKLNATDDLRAPLAFLLGKLDFQKDFREFRARSAPEGLFITAIPKSDKLPYSEVTFLTGPDFAIRKLSVKGQDNSTLEFAFENEKTNAALPEAMFRFTAPPGVEFVDSTNQH